MKEHSDYNNILACWFIYNFKRTEIITRAFDINNNFIEIKRYFKPYYFITNFSNHIISNNNKQKSLIFLINNDIYWMNFTNDNLLSNSEKLVKNYSNGIRLLYNNNKNYTHEFLFISSDFDKFLLVFNNNFSLISQKLFNSKTTKCIYSSFIASHKEDNENDVSKRSLLDLNKFFQTIIPNVAFIPN